MFGDAHNKFVLFAVGLMIAQMFIAPAESLTCVICKNGNTEAGCSGGLCRGDLCFTKSEPNEQNPEQKVWSKGCAGKDAMPQDGTMCTTKESLTVKGKTEICYCAKDRCNQQEEKKDAGNPTAAPTTQPATTVENTAQSYKQGLMELIAGLGLVVIAVING